MRYADRLLPRSSATHLLQPLMGISSAAIVEERKVAEFSQKARYRGQSTSSEVFDCGFEFREFTFSEKKNNSCTM